jgi:hypothetical protein
MGSTVFPAKSLVTVMKIAVNRSGKTSLARTPNDGQSDLGSMSPNRQMRIQKNIDHNFVIEYKKGLNILANYLSGFLTTENYILVFDPFQSDLNKLQMQDTHLQIINDMLNRNLGWNWKPLNRT